MSIFHFYQQGWSSFRKGEAVIGPLLSFFVFRGDLSVTLSIPSCTLQWPVYFFYSAFSNQAMTSFIFRWTAIQPNIKSRHFMQNPSDSMSEAGQPKSHSLINRLFNRLMLEWNEISSGHLFVRFWYFSVPKILHSF